MRLLGILASSVLKKITDLFNRTTSGSLGTTDTGQTWQATRGTWSANGTQATSADTAATYPLASVTFNQNATVSATVSEATGVSFWVTDANNWYASVAYHTTSSYSCGCSTCCNSCSYACSVTGANCSACGSSNSYTVTNATNFTCADLGYTQVSGSFCGGVSSPLQCCLTGSSCNTCTYSTTCTGSNCAQCGSYSCGCTTCTAQNYYMRLLQSIAGTVSNVISDYAVASLPVAIKVITSGNTITEYAYSDTAMTTSLGSTSTTPASPTRGSGVGIIKTPAAVTQGTTVDNFSAS